jgi:4-aminobutyrate aminotransferase-like enzyme
MTDASLLERRHAAMGRGAMSFYDEPIELVRGEGIWLFDAQGKQYMDIYNNVPVAGHCHPHIVEAMQRQASTLNTHSRYVSDTVLAYSERLMALHAEPLSSLVMSCSGSEALEVAVQMARTATGGQAILISNATYHGSTSEIRRMTFGPFEPDYKRISFPQSYRPLAEGASEDELRSLHLAEVERAIAELDAEGIPLAGMLFCPIFANEGLPDVPRGFLGEAAARVRDAGGLVILDEVQSGFGRTGRWWGYEVMDCPPDIVTMGKPMGAGIPLSGTGTSNEIASTFHEKCFYFNTTASTPLQAAVGSAVLDVIEEEGLLERSARVGGFLKSELMPFVDRYESVGDVRGQGLFVGIEWVSDREKRTADREGARTFVEKMKAKGFLMGAAGQGSNVLKLRPPLIFEQGHAELLLTALDETMQEMHG